MPFEQPAPEKKRLPNPSMWTDHDRPSDNGETVDSSIKETREQEIARLLGRSEKDIQGYERRDDI